VIRFENVGVRYGLGPEVLNDVSFDIEASSFQYLTGPSGAGKTTLMRLMFLGLKPSRGQLTVFDQNAATLTGVPLAAARRRIGVVFQDFRLLQRRTVRENTAFALEVTGAPVEEIEVAVERALRIVGLGKLADRYPDALSGGEQQRAAIARAIVGNPELLIADEPTGNLDPLISWEIMELLGQINQLGVTVLVATHDSDIVTTLRKRVLGLEGGRLIRDEQRGTYHRVG
jgi:cell division transport system ATP-binding protein